MPTGVTVAPGRYCGADAFAHLYYKSLSSSCRVGFVNAIWLLYRVQKPPIQFAPGLPSLKGSERRRAGDMRLTNMATASSTCSLLRGIPSSASFLKSPTTVSCSFGLRARGRPVAAFWVSLWPWSADCRAEYVIQLHAAAFLMFITPEVMCAIADWRLAWRVLGRGSVAKRVMARFDLRELVRKRTHPNWFRLTRTRRFCEQ